MIVNNLCGGLGNQLFQIATGHTLANDNNDEYGINYELKHNLIQGHPKVKYRNTLFKNIPVTTQVPANLYQEPNFHYSPIPYENNLLINGYLQSPKYFEHNKDDVKSLFTFPDEAKQKVDKAVAKVREKYDTVIGVHVRRGDYLLNPQIHPTCTVDYYKEAIEELGDDNSLCIVCTDTPEWVGQNLCNDTVILSNSVDELEDLYLLTLCDHVILSNSTFAWWGAWLNENKPTVIAPEIWFGPEGPQDYYDIYCDDWIKR
tara:strand:+ start:141 stop:917 length:777 start_codon:yes stop_codon:yes gene_type:complete